MTVRDTYNSSVATALTARNATNQAAALTAQEAIHAVGCNVGVNLSAGANASQMASIAAANAAYAVTRMKAEHDKQVAINNARAILQQTDTAPA